ncbi:Poly [ADP-ribose] polymerase 12 [Bagarius yarrelli]|uniref:Poly [ADP-ribose] polymerase 12 n=1 Tax=Bagarius yarrelli TaxID=175774 RepID=A0A556VAG8_BAGYA|nr:Poly [ADP-ribose] polymerase 12 [Bagarius yarrelli]
MSSLTACLLKRICANNGAMLYDELISSRGWDSGSYGRSYVDEALEGNDSLVTVFMNGQKTVIAKTAVKLCRAKDCSGCRNLHLCKFYLFGDCQYGRGRRGCRFSHDLQSHQNASVLQEHGLNQLDRRELCVLLLQSDPSILPQVCHSYNNGAGVYGRCEDGENCKRLHICEKYLRGPCQCPRAHDFYEPHPLKALKDRGVPTDLMNTMKTIYSNIEVLRKMTKAKSSQSSGKVQETSGQKFSRNDSREKAMNANATGGEATRTRREKTEICMYFIKGHCRNAGTTTDHSFIIGFHRLEFIGGLISVVSKIYFDTMNRGGEMVRRLSTVSSVIQPNYILTTEWAWYWQDEYGTWIQYASSGGGHSTASITCQDLEQKFTQDNKAQMEFTAGSQTYTISFQDMIQTNKRYGTKRLVRRRPVFVSAADAETIRKTRPTPISQKQTLPSHWNKARTPEIGYNKIQLQKDLNEYSTMANLFKSTMHGFCIQQIERIQNKSLWEVFQWQKDRMKKNNSGKEVAERQLFHGTDSKHLDAICHNNFDWRICGTHGTAFGKGSYFAKDANYSHSYTGQSTIRRMFVCRVLVGDYTVGQSSYTRPPSKDGGDTFFYDSCVDNVHNPSIFVVFEKHQIYPEYLISYTEGNQPSSSYTTSIPSPVSTSYQPTPSPRVPAATAVYQPSASTSSYTTSYSSPSHSKDNSCIIC